MTKIKKRAPEAINADTLIVGGGLVGGTLACALAAEGLRVAVVDAEHPETAARPTADGRVSAIALSSKRLLEAAGLWGDLARDAAPILDIRVAEGHTPFFLHYDSREVGGEPFGFMVENRNLRRAIARRIARERRIVLFAPARVKTLDRGASAVEADIETAQGLRRVRAPLVVAADGRASRTRRDAGIGVTKRDYDQTAIVCAVRHERSHDFIAHELFQPAGPFAILPMNGDGARDSGRRSAIVWSERPDIAPLMMALDDQSFCAEIQRRAGDFLGAISLDSPRWTYPLSVQFAQRMLAHRLALAGDAAHAMHPVAGQGFNMGLRDVAALAEVLSEAKSLGLDLGSAAVLERYGRWRRFDNGLMLAMTDTLVRFFSNDIGPIKAARALGLSAVNRIAPLRRLFARHAMGIVGDLPRAMRGAES